jgi:hypothetical protein
MVSAIAGRPAPRSICSGSSCPVYPRIPEIHIADAQELLARHTGEDPRGEPALAPAHERWLSDRAVREYGSEFLYVTGTPRPSARSTPIPSRAGRANPTASTCSSAGWRSSPAASACTGAPTTWPRWPSAARIRALTGPTSPSSRPGCRRTAASPWPGTLDGPPHRRRQRPPRHPLPPRPAPPHPVPARPRPPMPAAAHPVGPRPGSIMIISTLHTFGPGSVGFVAISMAGTCAKSK